MKRKKKIITERKFPKDKKRDISMKISRSYPLEY
jgi:hypothetical protein